MQLRQYQKDIVQEVHKEMIKNSSEICVSYPTGSGKSIIIAQLVKDFRANGFSVGIMVNISKLIPQLSKLFNELSIEHNIVKAGMEKSSNSDVHIIMQQTLNARKYLNLTCDVLIIDERHISFGSKTMNSVIKRLNPKQVIGFSATPIDAEGFFLDGVRVIDGLGVKELTEQGYLTTIRTFVAGFSEKLDFTEVDIKTGDYNEVQLSKIINTESYNNSVFECWYKLAKDKKTIAFCTGVNHAEALNQVFISNGIKSGVVHSKNKSKNNDLIFDKFSNNELQVICSIGMISTGWDEPSVECGISCRPTMTKRLVRQQQGRLARLFNGKVDALWLDFAKNTSQHGLYDEPLVKIDRIHRKTNKNIARRNDIISGIDLLVQKENDVVELLNRSEIKIRIKEIIDEKKKGNIKDLIQLFESSQDISELCELIVKIDFLYSGRVNNDTLHDWICNKWTIALNVNHQYEAVFIKAFKTRAKSIVQSGKTDSPKKLGQLYYFIDFLIEGIGSEHKWWRQ